MLYYSNKNSRHRNAVDLEQMKGDCSSGFPIRGNINRPVQSQKQARGLKFWIYVEEELYFSCTENKGADQLCSHCKADLSLCFCIIM